MRKLNELIVLVRGGDEMGTAVAHRLFRSNFRVCITESAQPLSICRGVAFSEAVYDTFKRIDGVVAERSLPTVENIYRIWRERKIPVVVDPEVGLRAILHPDVLVNALMLKRVTNIKVSDAPLVIGIGSGFTAGLDVHMIVESNRGINLGKVLTEGPAEEDIQENGIEGSSQILFADDTGVFTTDRSICDLVNAGDVLGRLGEVEIVAPTKGVLRGVLRSEMKVLPKTRLAEICPGGDQSGCLEIRDSLRAVAGGVLEGVMQVCNTIEGT
jgi:xanthine dehydrogenase accessory factor